MPKIVDKESRRKEIARTAMALFAQKGFDNTSIREITSRAGMGKGTFYDYFKDKDDILSEVMHIMFADWTGIMITKIKDTRDPLVQLSILLKEGAKLGDSFEQLMIIYVDIWRRSVNQKGDDEFIENFRSFLRESKKDIAKIVDTAKAQGKIRKEIDSSIIATIFIALIDGLCLHYMVLKSEMEIDTISTAFFKTLLNGMK